MINGFNLHVCTVQDVFPYDNLAECNWRTSYDRWHYRVLQRMDECTCHDGENFDLVDAVQSIPHEEVQSIVEAFKNVNCEKKSFQDSYFFSPESFGHGTQHGHATVADRDEIYLRNNQRYPEPYDYGLWLEVYEI